MEEMVKRNEDKAQFIFVWKKTCICSYIYELQHTFVFHKHWY